MSNLLENYAVQVIAVCDFLDAVQSRPLALRVAGVDVFVTSSDEVTLSTPDKCEWYSTITHMRGAYTRITGIPAIPPAKPAGAADIPGTAWHPSGNIPQGA